MTSNQDSDLDISDELFLEEINEALKEANVATRAKEIPSSFETVNGIQVPSIQISKVPVAANELLDFEFSNVADFDILPFDLSPDNQKETSFYNNYTVDSRQKVGITPDNCLVGKATPSLFNESLSQIFDLETSIFPFTPAQSNNSGDLTYAQEFSLDLKKDPFDLDLLEQSSVLNFPELLGSNNTSTLKNIDPELGQTLYDFGITDQPYESLVRTTNQQNLPKSKIHKPVKINRAADRFLVSEDASIEISVGFDDATVTCLDCSISYHGYTGTIYSITKLSPYLVNSYMGEHQVDPRTYRGQVYSEEGISASSCVHQRVKYDREINELHGTISNIIYKTSSLYSLETPYEPQYYRFELDSEGEKVNESKCGLCPYCEEVKFLPFKNSSYLSHLTLEHGVFSNNFLTPDGIYFGKYQVNKRDRSGSGSRRDYKPREVDAMLCPQCHSVIEVGCWSMKDNKLLSYFRHFKNCHGEDTTKSRNAHQLPEIRPRGRTLHVTD